MKRKREANAKASGIQPETRFSYLWVIRNYSTFEWRCETGPCLTSPEFSATGYNGISCKLKLHPNEQVYRNCLSLDILFSCLNKEIHYRVKILAIDSTKRCSPVCLASCSGSAFPGHITYLGSFWSESIRPMHTDQDTLSLYCEVRIDDETALDGMVYVKTPERQLATDFSHLLKKPKFSDVKLIVKGKEFPAHKAILAARSDVFSAMFERDMLEKTQNVVNIFEMDCIVVQKMLRFIYTGRANLDKVGAEKMLVAANKYSLDDLKKLCEELLCYKLTIENVLDTLLLADTHNSQQLKNHAIDFVNTHYADILETDGWKDLIDQCPHLVSEAWLAASTHKISIPERFASLYLPEEKRYLYSSTADWKITDDVVQLNLPDFCIHPPHCWSYTQLKSSAENEVNFRWEIDDDSIMVNHEPLLPVPYYQSHPFPVTATSSSTIKWRLQLHNEGQGFVSLKLQCNSVRVYVDAEFHLSVTDDGRDQKLAEMQDKKVFLKGDHWESETFQCSVLPFIATGDVKPNVSVECVVRFLSKISEDSMTVQKKATKARTGDFMLPAHLSNLLDSEKLSDVVLVANEHEFPAHKAILAARSTTFSDMFESEKTSRFEIADMQPGAFSEMLRFIYTGKVSPINLDRFAVDLLGAAYDYSLDGLKMTFEDTLCTKLTIEQAAGALVLADKHNLIRLKGIVTEFIKGHPKQVAGTRGWKNLIQNQPHLLTEFYKSAMEKTILYPYMGFK